MLKKGIFLVVCIIMWFYTEVSANYYGRDTYYIGNAAECRYTTYICERGYESFSNSRGCGCTGKSTVSTTYVHQPAYSYNNTQTYSYNNSSLPRATSNQYYVANDYTCNNRNYSWDYGWRQFTDVQGCGCKRGTYDNISSSNSSKKDEAEDIVEAFIDRLEYTGYSDREIVRIIERMELRLEDLADYNSRYSTMVSYLRSELRTYKREYERREEDNYEEVYRLFNKY